VAYTSGKMKKNRIKTLGWRSRDHRNVALRPYIRAAWSSVIRTNVRRRALVRPCAIRFGVADAR
jgi:hypothetical protein